MMRWSTTGIPIALALVLTAGVLLARGWPDRGSTAPPANVPAAATNAALAATVAAPAVTGTPAATPVQVTPTPAPSLEEEVGAAYLHYWNVYTRAVRGLDESALATVLTGLMLERTREEITGLRERGQAVEIRVEHHFVVVEANAEAGTATVFDEYVNRSFLVDAASGERAGAEPDPTTLSDTYYLVLEDERWKVQNGVRTVVTTE